MNKEEKEKTIRVLDLILGLINYLELDKKLERKYFIEPRFPNKKVLKKIEKALDEKFIFDIPEMPLTLPLRRLMAQSKLHKDELIKVLNNLKDNEVITAMDISELQKPKGVGFDAKLPIDVNKEKLIQYKNNLSKGIIIRKKEKIKHIAIDEKSYSLIINGQDYVSFRSKRNKKDLEAETKQFRVLFHLWEFRKEIKNGRINQKLPSDFVSLSNVATGASCTEEAARQHIKRLKTRFKKEGLPIDIKASGTGLYQLVVELE